jgi:ERCC4-type nuclease
LEKSRKYYRKREAVNSENPNKILLLFDQRTAHALFEHSLNVVSALKMKEEDLLSLSGIGPKSLISIKKAMRTALGNPGEKFSM